MATAQHSGQLCGRQAKAQLPLASDSLGSKNKTVPLGSPTARSLTGHSGGGMTRKGLSSVPPWEVAHGLITAMAG